MNSLLFFLQTLVGWRAQHGVVWSSSNSSCEFAPLCSLGTPSALKTAFSLTEI